MFIGREKEIALLREKNWREKAVLSVVYGRRRVGKTALVEKAFEHKKIWKFEGIEGEGQAFQLRNFLMTLQRLNDNNIQIDFSGIKTWQNALIALHECIENREIIVFFDEFQWITSMRKTLVSIFKWAWDNYLSKNTHCQFVLCGSISSFIVKKVLRSRALYGRIDIEIDLKPLAIDETMKIFPPGKTKQEIVETYMILGGIPQYLVELNPSKSIVQNLNQMAFSPNGYFVKEHNRIFVSHFGKNDIYEKIIIALTKKTSLTNENLAAICNYTVGGRFLQYLEDLVLADFIRKEVPVDKNQKSKLVKYRLSDEFLHFYYKFVYEHIRTIEAGTSKTYAILSGQAYNQWRGYAFERLCIKHARFIARTLEFSGIQFSAGQWFRSWKKQAAQIDLLFKRADNILTVCELKYVNKINSSVIDAMEQKISVLQNYFDCGIQKVLICGKKIPIPSKLNGYFDAILFAEDVFFRN